MKKKIFVTLMLILGVYLTIYPYLYNTYSQRHQSKVIEEYSKAVEEIDESVASKIKDEVRKYNKSLINRSVVLTDPFDKNTLKEYDAESYANMLDVEKNGIISVIEIPKIDVNLPIYYGTESEILEHSLGQLEGTSFPIGEVGGHCVITGHTGLPNVKLFTDLTELENGDVFFINTLNDVYAYKVNNVAIVTPEDTRLLRVDKDNDYVTLITCYPYGINSHRLLVRGERVDYEFAKGIENQESNVIKSQWNREYFKTIIICVVVYGGMFIFYQLFKAQKRKRGDKWYMKFKILIATILIIGFSLIIYPFISQWISQREQGVAIREYFEDVEEIGEDKKEEIEKEVELYNQKVRAENSEKERDYEFYSSFLETKNEVIGVIEIPKIKVKLPIYKGSSDDILQKGAGHIEGTSLPTGEKGSHCYISAHRGLAKAVMFRDLDQLSIGDEFSVYVLGEKMTYEVDKVDVVEPDELEKIEIDNEKDYVTLVTCTPYGINSHRLLVRGIRKGWFLWKSIRYLM